MSGREATKTWGAVGIGAKVDLIKQVRGRIAAHAGDWVDACVAAKGLRTSVQKSEEVLTGPLGLSRYLMLLQQSLTSLLERGRIELPGGIRSFSDGGLAVPVFPARGVYDPLTFAGLKAEVWFSPPIDKEAIHGCRLQQLLHPPDPVPHSVVLGAGNVAAIPVTDALSKLFQEGHLVTLKLNPVNDYLHDVFQRILQPVIEPGWLSIVTGGAEVGRNLVKAAETDAVHITGAQSTHDAIVWGADPQQAAERKRNNQPLLRKQITSELGNVSPWVIVPGQYSPKELRMQAMNIAASLTNNAGFNCVTTRVIVTSKGWPQREKFLSMLQDALQQVPARKPYYPGTEQRYEHFLGEPASLNADGTMPWRLLPDFPADSDSLLLREESFLPVSVEVGLKAESDVNFLQKAVSYCNEKLYGTLSVAVTVPSSFQRRHRDLLRDQVQRLRYGSVCVNQWPGLVYGLMTPPWGGAPGTTLQDVQSGQGSVHNLYFLDGFDKTVFTGPLCNWPKPVWFPSHHRAEQIGWRLVDLYTRPSPFKLPGLGLAAVLG